MAKKAVKEVKKEAKVSNFEVLVSVNGLNLEVKGEHLLPIFKGLELPPIIKTGMGILVKSGKVSRERLLSRMQARRVFKGGDNALKFFVYSLEKLLK